MATRRTTRSKQADKLNKVACGEIVTWNAKSGSVHTHSAIVSALQSAGLNHELAREFLPRHAWARAARKMEDGRLIDKVNETADVLVFQFTKQFVNSKKEEVQFKKETLVRLNKTTGEITCDDKAIQEVAQNELNRATQERTTNDVTKIVQRLFDDNASLFPIRDQGGAYFVPQEHIDFIAKVQTFLGQLGGSMRRFEVADGKNSKSAIASSIAESFESLIQEHNEAVEGFTLSTRADTLENAANRIRDTRVKLEAYAHYLSGQSKELLKQVDSAKKKLHDRIQGLEKERAELPADSDQNRLFGYHPTAVIRWMGAAGWKFSDAKAALEHLEFSPADATIRTQLAAGKRGERGAPAKLSKEQGKTLEQARTGK